MSEVEPLKDEPVVGTYSDEELAAREKMIEYTTKAWMGDSLDVRVNTLAVELAKIIEVRVEDLRDKYLALRPPTEKLVLVYKDGVRVEERIVPQDRYIICRRCRQKASPSLWKRIKYRVRRLFMRKTK